VTLREALGGDASRVHELVDRLLDREDSVIVLIDGRRVISYAGEFGLSPCQLELVTNDIERAVSALGMRRIRRRARLRRQTQAEREGPQDLDQAA
jgi:hypothetical protein